MMAKSKALQSLPTMNASLPRSVGPSATVIFQTRHFRATIFSITMITTIDFDGDWRSNEGFGAKVNVSKQGLEPMKKNSGRCSRDIPVTFDALISRPMEQQ